MADILVVDDDPVNRLLLTTILEHHGHVIFEAADGTHALAWLRERSPDLIIVDLNMPHMDGLEFLKVFRADARHAAVTIILHTATTVDDGLRGLLELYAVDGVLAKPCEPHEVVRSVEAALR
ncbi:MAG TPA: response regulator [Candidatus Eremiobacteraceae bacterium]|nr:response regulator [Candidatus Eremiobacteraceae bacterium]